MANSDSLPSKPLQRIVNDADRVVEDMLRGFLLAHPDLVAATENPRVLRYAGTPVADKVGVVTGGGSGHKPAFIGYLGRHFCDAVAVGEIFSSPSAQAFLDAFRTADSGKGVACLYGNYAGDNMNVRTARQLAKLEGIVVKTVVANDDVASAPADEREKRRGVAGEILMWKVGGAKAASGASLDEVIAVSQRAIDQTRSIGIGLGPCTIPAVGHPNFTIEPGTMEIGIGHHGEPGVRVAKLGSADEIAEIATEYILPDLPFEKGDEVVVLVSGLGATPVMELYIAFQRFAGILDEHGIAIHRSYVGNYFTSLEMTGITFTVMKLDDELKALIDMPAASPGLTQPPTDPFPAEKSAQRSRASGSHSDAAKEVDRPDPVGRKMVLALANTIISKRAYLSEIDGAIGDGDHGVNMAKGFQQVLNQLENDEVSLAGGLALIGRTLLDIGGSMGPIYGAFFINMSLVARSRSAEGEEITPELCARMLTAAREGIEEIGNARIGDKTLMDTLIPAENALVAANENGLALKPALQEMVRAAEAGKDSTKDLVAKVGRASRLGERSRGVLDAGATSCHLILAAFADTLSGDR